MAILGGSCQYGLLGAATGNFQVSASRTSTILAAKAFGKLLDADYNQHIEQLFVTPASGSFH